MTIQAYKNGGFNLNERNRIYSIPIATIKRHADGKKSNMNEMKNVVDYRHFMSK